MRLALNIFAGIVLAAHALVLNAADNTVLIQSEPTGGFRVWHIEGETKLGEHELLLLEASATPEGGPAVETGYGPARAYESAAGIVIEIPAAKRDTKLLLDRDACSALRVWHWDGATQLTDDQVGDLVVSATPDGGRRVNMGDRVAKAFTTRLGVMATIWKPLWRKPQP